MAASEYSVPHYRRCAGAGGAVLPAPQPPLLLPGPRPPGLCREGPAAGHRPGEGRQGGQAGAGPAGLQAARTQVRLVVGEGLALSLQVY